MNTGCQRTAREALLYRDGELPSTEQEAFGRHLPDCPTCLARLEDGRAMGTLLGEAFRLMAGSPPQGFADQVMREVRRRTPVEKAVPTPWLESLVAGWRWFALGGLALAAAVATVVLPLLRAAHGPSVAPLQQAEEAALQIENEAHIHRLSVESSDTHPMVLQTAEGHTVIWMISDSQFAGDAGDPENP